MASSSQASRKEAAKDLVRSIAKGHGHLGEAVYAKMDPDTRRQVQEAILTKDTLIGSSVMLLARELYSKDVRFIFELLQNADDNHFTTARAKGSTPYVAFHLYKKRIIIDCNEDGFTEPNLRAICSIGKSSKVGGHGYIGEKGIGFKSVFKAAWKVHIQSGDLSFSFTHHPGDPGMGMISPEWEEPTVELKAPLTRITLYLFDDQEAVTRHESIKKQLNDLECNMLLFLKNIRCIFVYVYDDLNKEESSTVMTVNIDEATHKAVLRKDRFQGDNIHEETQAFCHVTRHLATGLARSGNRTYTAAEEESRSYSKAEVILAFPFSEESVPIIEAQNVFAFLPLRRLGFNFLIQTDFVTMANREDVVTTAPRNLALLDGIADAFIKAVHEMYGHDTLRYQWMRYLTNMKTYPWDPFWRKLVDKIDQRVRDAKILQPRRLGPPRQIGNLRRLPPSHLEDHTGLPLFEDLPGQREMYISTGYLPGDLAMLEEYALKKMCQADFLERVKHDLCQPNSSRMKNAATSEEWHSRAAATINSSFGRNLTRCVATTRALEILPLRDGSWVSSTSRQVFFPKINSRITVPVGLGLSILAPSACENAERVRLFTSLGAKTVDVKVARERIFEQYIPSETPPEINLETSLSHLVLLYQTHRSGQSLTQYRHIRLHDTEGYFLSPMEFDYYFTSEEPYSLWQLSQQGRDERFSDHASFVHPKYFESPPNKGPSNLSWEEWLSLLGVFDHPRIASPEGSTLSPVFLNVAELLPSEFLGFLRYAMHYKGQPVQLSDTIIDAIREVEVLCQGGQDWSYPLLDTYLPLPSLQEKCSAFMDKEYFPFLNLGGEPWSSDEDARDWAFLKERLGVGAQDNLQFYIDLLEEIYLNEGYSLDNPSHILSIYSRIYTRCMEARDRSAAQELVKKRCDYLIYVPQHDDQEDVWANLEDCLYDAPRDLMFKHPLIARYEAASPQEDLGFLVRFFRDILGVPSCTWTDIVEDLKFLKAKVISDFDRIRSRYEDLDQRRRDWVTVDINTAKIRELFESESLIFVQNEQGQYQWMKPSECLWSSATEIRQKISLNKYYDDDLEDFFVEVLGVSRLTINMVYDELNGVDPALTTVKQVKDWLLSMNAFLETETPVGSPERLLKNNVLPVRYPNGGVRLSPASTEFAIVDRRPLEVMFRDKAKLLDFTLSQVNGLQPLIDWMKLGSRFLSKLTRENSVVNPETTYPLSDPTRHIRRKAHALTRVAVHVKSPRAKTTNLAQTFYDLLRNAETWETHGISSVVTINQDGTPISVELEQSEVHITSSETPLKIYVPHDEVLQEVCFGSALPEQLARWMVTDPVTQQIEGKLDESAIKVVTGIFGAKSAAAMSRILDNQGIVDIDIPNAALEETNRRSSEENGGEPSVSRELVLRQMSPSVSRHRSPSTPPSTTADPDADHYYISANDDDEPHSPPPRTLHSPLAIRSSAGLHHTPGPQPTEQTAEQYGTFLEHVVTSARATNGLPRHRTVSVATPPHHLPSHYRTSQWLMRECATTLERDCKIGAAGELFTFELLSSLLPDFPRPCWQSTIRRLVTGRTDGHPDYVDMEPWTGGEISDFVYDDVDGVLTGLLVDGMYLFPPIWATRRGVRYYIEVKSTFGECDGPFYMSDRQHRMMSELMTDHSVYLIFRVFRMTSGSIGVKIYVDPARMEREGSLKFSADTWTVTPG